TPEGDLRRHADVAQLVEHHLAKVRVAGSNPVVRSERPPTSGLALVEWPRGEATACKAVYTGSNPVSTSQHARAISSVGERYLDTVEATGSIPVSPTTLCRPEPRSRSGAPHGTTVGAVRLRAHSPRSTEGRLRLMTRPAPGRPSEGCPAAADHSRAAS